MSFPMSDSMMLAIARIDERHREDRMCKLLAHIMHMPAYLIDDPFSWTIDILRDFNRSQMEASKSCISLQHIWEYLMQLHAVPGRHYDLDELLDVIVIPIERHLPPGPNIIWDTILEMLHSSEGEELLKPDTENDTYAVDIIESWKQPLRIVTEYEDTSWVQVQNDRRSRTYAARFPEVDEGNPYTEDFEGEDMVVVHRDTRPL